MLQAESLEYKCFIYIAYGLWFKENPILTQIQEAIKIYIIIIFSALKFTINKGNR